MKIIIKIDENTIAFREKAKLLIDGMKKSEMNPNLSQVSRVTGMAVSTVFDKWRWFKKHFDITISITFKLKQIPKPKKILKPWQKEMKERFK